MKLGEIFFHELLVPQLQKKTLQSSQRESTTPSTYAKAKAKAKDTGTQARTHAYTHTHTHTHTFKLIQSLLFT